VQHSLPTAGVCMFGEAVPEGPHVGIGESKPSHDAPAVGVKHPVWRSSRLAGTLLIVEYDVNGPETADHLAWWIRCHISRPGSFPGPSPDGGRPSSGQTAYNLRTSST
jgi:hypothetical protein